MSIKANELRVGNWVQRPEQIRSKLLDDDRIYFLVDSIMIRDCEHYESNWAFEPIPLTPEILEKAGFEWDDIDKGNETVRGLFKKFILMLPHHNGLNWYAAPYGYPLMPQRTLYLHQLQNLYFALTGEELIVKF